MRGLRMRPACPAVTASGWRLGEGAQCCILLVPQAQKTERYPHCAILEFGKISASRWHTAQA